MSKFCNIIQILLSQNSCSLIDFSLNSFWYRYASSFQFLGDYQDDRPIDSMGRRKTTIVAIDALDDPKNKQYAAKGLLRCVVCVFYSLRSDLSTALFATSTSIFKVTMLFIYFLQVSFDQLVCSYRELNKAFCGFLHQPIKEVSKKVIDSPPKMCVSFFHWLK